MWGMIGPASKFAFHEGVAALEVAFWRGLLGGLLFLVHALCQRSLRIALRDLPAIAAFGVFGVAGLEASNLLAVQLGGAAFASVMLYTAPAWVAVFSWMFFGESMPPGKLGALALTLAGVVGISLSGMSDSSVTLAHFAPSALFWGVISGLSYALFYIFGKIYFSKYSPSAVYAIAFPVGSLAILPFADFEHKTSAAWGVLSFNGVVSTYLAYYFYSNGLKRVEPTRAAILASLEPVVAAVLAYLVWRERLTLHGYVSAGCVLTGVLMMVLFQPDRR